MEFLSPGANQAQYPGRTNADPSVPSLQAYLDSADDASFGTVTVSPSRPRGRRGISTPTHTATASTKSSTNSSISVFTIAGIIAASLAVLLLLSLPFYLKARQRKRQNTNVRDVENRGSLPASYETGSHGSLSVDHSNDLTQGKSSPPPLILQPSPEAPAPVDLPTSPTSLVPGGKNGRERALPRPPPLLLRPERPDREASQSGSSTRSKSRITKILDRGSLLPNPWDTDSRPRPPAFEREFYRLPSVSASVRSANSVKGGLPRTPRAPRTFVSPEVRPLEATQSAVDRTPSGPS